MSSFFRLALSLSEEDEVLPQYLATHYSLLASLWSLRIDNHVKETYWRLFLDALPLASRMHKEGAAGRCLCHLDGVSPAAQQDRRHTFWDCPLAASLRVVLQRELRTKKPQATLTIAHLWLMHNPAKDWLSTSVWQVVCLAALYALDRGRAFLFSPHDAATDYFLVMQQAKTHVALTFHKTLSFFCTTGRLPKADFKRLQKTSLFLSVDEHSRLRVSFPPPDNPYGALDEGN
jgi:hypothetical protein